MIKKIILPACMILSSTVYAGNSQSSSGWSADISVTPWLASWDQKSTAADRFGAEAIVVDYAIEDTIAYSFDLSAGYNNYLFSFKSVQQSESVAQNNKEVNFTQFSFIAVDFFGGFNLDYRYTQGSFSGLIDGADNTGGIATATFESDVRLQDISLIFYKGLGVGLRQINYDLPQDLYLVNQSNPNTPIAKGFEEITYSGLFFQLVAMSEDHFSTKRDQEYGYSYVGRYGFGQLDPGGDFLQKTEAAYGQTLMEKGDSTFFELDVSGYKRFALGGSVIKTSLGYRFTKLTAEFDSNSSYALVTDFETTFSGPYLALSAEFR